MRRASFLAVLALSGCLWRGYGRVLEVHLQVLESMAIKICALTTAPPPPSEAMGEFVYPLKRAREVEQQYRSRSGRPSYTAFGGVVQRYEALVLSFDRARVSPEAWSAAAPGVCESSRAVVGQIDTVRQQLTQEG